jgi:3,4-dihydroxy 2-butanone 4-phosphate synthase/GTP cyclohydrolase II
MQAVDEVDLGPEIEAVRRGDVVRVVSHKEASDDASSTAGVHLILAAERATPEKLRRVIKLTDESPIFVTTRDRLEQLRFAGVPLGDDGLMPEASDVAQRRDAQPWSPSDIAAAATSLAGNDPAAARAALRNFTVRCSDWGGVVNCPRVYEAAVDLSRLASLMPAAVVFKTTAARPNGSALSYESTQLPTVLIGDLIEYRRSRTGSMLRRHGPQVRMPTRHGRFTLQAYEDTLTGQLHLALWTGEFTEPVLTRVHSECLTGDLLGSLRCDCGPQLDRALERLAEEGHGLLLYLRQEGRGIGLINKLHTYKIQDQGFDTVEANEQLGFSADLRDYTLAAKILVDLGIHSINLLTNNPQKVRGLKKHGITIAERVPLVVEPCAENEAYLDVKRKKLGHLL